MEKNFLPGICVRVQTIVFHISVSLSNLLNIEVVFYCLAVFLRLSTGLLQGSGSPNSTARPSSALHSRRDAPIAQGKLCPSESSLDCTSCKNTGLHLPITVYLPIVRALISLTIVLRKYVYVDDGICSMHHRSPWPENIMFLLNTYFLLSLPQRMLKLCWELQKAFLSPLVTENIKAPPSRVKWLPAYQEMFSKGHYTGKRGGEPACGIH